MPEPCCVTEEEKKTVYVSVRLSLVLRENYGRHNHFVDNNAAKQERSRLNENKRTHERMNEDTQRQSDF